MSKKNNFNIRVYGLIFKQDEEVLISDEIQLGMKMTKFPGGGLKQGEGPIDCLVREIREECNGQEIKNIKHFYTTDFYQKALFYNDIQLISIYYQAKLANPLKFKISTIPFDFIDHENGNQSFRWVNLKSFSADNLTFPIDKKVFCML